MGRYNRLDLDCSMGSDDSIPAGELSAKDRIADAS